MLLRRTHLQLLVLSSLCLGLALPACTVNSTETTTSTTGVGASGGEGTSSNNGAGGIGVGGEGAMGGTGVGGGGAGTGGSGGQCVGEAGTGLNDADCDTANMPISKAASTCGANMTDPPPGVAVCHHAFDIYLPGSAENLYDCLAAISVAPQEACSDTNVQNCVTKVHTEACDVPEVQQSCKDYVKACNDFGDPSLTEDNCNFLLAPFNATALGDVQACVDATETGDCKATLEGCWDQVATIP
jgi:hypothetical protein